LIMLTMLIYRVPREEDLNPQKRLDKGGTFGYNFSRQRVLLDKEVMSR